MTQADRRDSFYSPDEALAPEVRVQRQRARLQRTVAAAYAGAPGVRARMDGCGLRSEHVHTLADLGPLPVLRKDALPQLQAQAPPFGGLLSRPVTSLRRIFVSPGPIYDPEPPGPDYWGLAPALHAAGFRAGDVALVTFSFHLTPAGHMMDAALQQLGCVVVPGGVGNTDIQARALGDLGVTGIVGTPSFTATLLERARALGVRHRVEIAFASAEPLPDSLRSRLQEEFGVRVTQGYALADLGLVAYECPQACGLHLSDRVAVEILDPDSGTPVPSGHPGEVVLTLLEPPYALIRFGTGDLAAELPGTCPCGRTSPRLRGILGRVGEAVKIRGLFVHPSEADRIVAQIPEVTRYQIVVRRADHRDEATVRIEVRPGSDVQTVAARFADVIQEGLRVRLAVEPVPPGTLEEGAPKILDLRQWR